MSDHYYFVAIAAGAYENASNATLNLMFCSESDSLTPNEVAASFVNTFYDMYKADLSPHSREHCGTIHPDGFDFCPVCGADIAPVSEEQKRHHCRHYFMDYMLKGDVNDFSYNYVQHLEAHDWFMHAGSTFFEPAPSNENSTVYYLENIDAAIEFGVENINFIQPDNLFLLGVTNGPE